MDRNDPKVQEMVYVFFDNILGGDKGTIDKLSKALTVYAFRNGPVEDMHSNGQLSEDDMKTLNKFMVNRFAGLLTMISQDEWPKILQLMGLFASGLSEWDEAVPDTAEFDAADEFLKICGTPPSQL